MSDVPQPQTFELAVSAAINKERADSVKFTRYNPWRLGLYVTGSLFVPVAAAAVGVLAVGWGGSLIGLTVLPVPIFVMLWAVEAALVEHQRLVAERAQLRRAGGEHLVPTAAASPAAPMVATRKHLKLGYLHNGVMTAPASPPDPGMQRLRKICLQLAQLGSDGNNWSRSALAEGPNARMGAEDWDAASAELQALGLFEVKAGRGGGLRPAAGRDLADSLARLEMAL